LRAARCRHRHRQAHISQDEMRTRLVHTPLFDQLAHSE
jgi:hypothetical protein